MTGVFDWLMRRMPQILVGVACFFYVVSVLNTIVEGGVIRAFQDDLTSTTFKVRAVLIVFFQPLIPALLMMAAAAALWRFDRWWTTRDLQVAE